LIQIKGQLNKKTPITPSKRESYYLVVHKEGIAFK